MLHIYIIIYTAVGCTQWHLQNFSVVMPEEVAHPHLKKQVCAQRIYNPSKAISFHIAAEFSP